MLKKGNAMAIDYNKIRTKRKDVLANETKQSLLNWFYKRRLEQFRRNLGEGEIDFVISKSSSFTNSGKDISIENKFKAGESNYSLAA